VAEVEDEVGEEFYGDEHEAGEVRAGPRRGAVAGEGGGGEAHGEG
jgi:hypothetical protein